MNKAAYHLNKQKTPSKNEGKFLYYYPCNEKDKANIYVYGKPYFVVEVTERELNALLKLDELEYKNWHTYYRHNEPFPDDEETLAPDKQEKWLNRSVPFAVLSDERLDRISKGQTRKQSGTACKKFTIPSGQNYKDGRKQYPC